MNSRSVNWPTAAVGAIVLVLATVVATLAIAGGDDEESRTYYESLALSSPEEAVVTFTGAFAEGDHLAAYLSLSPSAQMRLEQLVNLLQHGDLIDTSGEGITDLMRDEIPLFADGFGEAEHFDAGWYLQDQFWTFAADHDVFLIDLRGEVEILDVGTERLDDYPTVDVAASVEGIDGETVFRLRQVPSGTWKVHQVIVPGGDEDQVPWSVVPPPVVETVEYELGFMVPCPAASFDSARPLPEGITLVANPPCGEGGAGVNLRASGLPAGATGSIWFVLDSEHDIRLDRGDFTVDADGRVETVFTVPDRPSDEVQTVVLEVEVPG